MFEEKAIEMNPEGYYLCFSGGKDSQVIYELAKQAKVKFRAYYNVTTVDPPELVYFIRDVWDIVFDSGIHALSFAKEYLGYKEAV